MSQPDEDRPSQTDSPDSNQPNPAHHRLSCSRVQFAERAPPSQQRCHAATSRSHKQVADTFHASALRRGRSYPDHTYRTMSRPREGRPSQPSISLSNANQRQPISSRLQSEKRARLSQHYYQAAHPRSPLSSSSRAERNPHDPKALIPCPTSSPARIIRRPLAHDDSQQAAKASPSTSALRLERSDHDQPLDVFLQNRGGYLDDSESSASEGERGWTWRSMFLLKNKPRSKSMKVKRVGPSSEDH